VRHWKVRHGSYEDCPTAFGGADRTTYFVDPPYVDKGRYYRINHVDHAKVGAWCRTLPGQAIVCEQDGADWLPFESLATIKSTKGTSAEAVWLHES
jgi:16S rRNA G966 N2-methylase RsmD